MTTSQQMQTRAPCRNQVRGRLRGATTAGPGPPKRSKQVASGPRINSTPGTEGTSAGAATKYMVMWQWAPAAAIPGLETARLLETSGGRSPCAPPSGDKGKGGAPPRRGRAALRTQTGETTVGARRRQRARLGGGTKLHKCSAPRRPTKAGLRRSFIRRVGRRVAVL